MTRRRIAALAGLVVVGAVGAAAWWAYARTRPDAIGPRVADALIARHPGTTVEALDTGTLPATVLRAASPSGVYIDLQLTSVRDACRDRPLRCGDAVDRALDDVDRADRATREPQRSLIRAMVIGESSPGFRMGYIAEPLIGPLEIRYALVDGVASTFVTAAIADRLGLTQAGVRATAITALRSEPDVDLQKIDGSIPALYRVLSPGDPAASLLDRDRMKRFARRLGSARLDAIVPARGSLYLAAGGSAERRALRALQTRLRGSRFKVGDAELIAYDTEAEDGAVLSSATTP